MKRRRSRRPGRSRVDSAARLVARSGQRRREAGLQLEPGDALGRAGGRSGSVRDARCCTRSIELADRSRSTSGDDRPARRAARSASRPPGRAGRPAAARRGARSSADRTARPAAGGTSRPAVVDRSGRAWPRGSRNAGCSSTTSGGMSRTSGAAARVRRGDAESAPIPDLHRRGPSRGPRPRGAAPAGRTRVVAPGVPGRQPAVELPGLAGIAVDVGRAQHVAHDRRRIRRRRRRRGTCVSTKPHSSRRGDHGGGLVRDRRARRSARSSR